MAKYVKVNILGRPHRNLFALGNRTGNIGKMQMIHCCAVALGPSPQELGGSASSRRDDSTGRRSAKGSAPGSVSGLANYSHWVSLHVGSQEWSFVAFVVRITGWNLQCKTHHSNLICGIVQTYFRYFSILILDFSFIFSRPSTQPRWCFSRSASICCGRSGGVSQWYPSAMVAWDRVWHSGCHARLIFTEMVLNIFLFLFGVLAEGG